MCVLHVPTSHSIEPHGTQGVAAANARRNGHHVAYMPSHQSLVQGGHAHLVPLIEAAGGFLEVCLHAKVVACATTFQTADVKQQRSIRRLEVGCIRSDRSLRSRTTFLPHSAAGG